MNSPISNTNLYKEIAWTRIYTACEQALNALMQATHINHWRLRQTAAKFESEAKHHAWNWFEIQMIRDSMNDTPIYPPETTDHYMPIEVAVQVLYDVRLNSVTVDQIETTLYLVQRAGMDEHHILAAEVIKWRNMTKAQLADYMATTNNSNVANKRLTHADINWRQYERDEEWYWHVEDMQRAAERLLVEPYQGPSDEWGIYDAGDLPRLRMLDMELCHELANMDNARIDKYLAN